MNKKERIKQERTELAKQVIAYFNKESDHRYDYKARGTLKLFTAEWSHKYGFNQYRGVIDYFVLRWKDDGKMDRYLRPATLFGPEKFPDYLEEARAKIRDERNRGRLPAFKTYCPVEPADDAKLPAFSTYNPNG